MGWQKMSMRSLRVGTRHGGHAADALVEGVGVFAEQLHVDAAAGVAGEHLVTGDRHEIFLAALRHISHITLLWRLLSTL